MPTGLIERGVGLLSGGTSASSAVDHRSGGNGPVCSRFGEQVAELVGPGPARRLW
jgi:hypothetical protein